MADSFAHLHVHTEYSMLDGAARITDLMQAVQDEKMPAVAMTDHGNIFGAFEFWKAAKAHGMQRQIEGRDIAGRKVVVVEDTTTTGGSPIAAIEAARAAGAEVLGVATIVDRATGAGEKIEALGVPYHYLYGLADLGLA